MIMADGVTPANEGRGYVLRRLLRRVVRSMRLLGYRGRVAARAAAGVPGRDGARRTRRWTTDFERISHLRVRGGGDLRPDPAGGHRDPGHRGPRRPSRPAARRCPGEQAFQLHDTYGFPIDLTLEMAAEQGLTVDEDGFRRLMAEQRQRAKADAQSRKGGGAGRLDGLPGAARRAARPTSSRTPRWTAEATVLGLVRDGELVSGATEGELVELVLDVTPFYAESGGQDSDAGVDHRRRRSSSRSSTCSGRSRGWSCTRVRVVRGEVAAGRSVHAEVDREWRLGASPGALRHARRARGAAPGARPDRAAGRLVQRGRATCGWTSPGRSSCRADTRSEVEEDANLALRADLPVQAFYTSLPEARRIGALALFGETYDEEVRVVEIGGEWSRELCGGTHVRHSSQVGPLAITSEASVGAGMRRVEALVGRGLLRLPAPASGRCVDRLTQTLGRRADAGAGAGPVADRPAARRPRRSSTGCGPSRCWPAPARWRRRPRTSAASRWSRPRRPAGSAAASCARWRSTCAAG